MHRPGVARVACDLRPVVYVWPMRDVEVIDSERRLVAALRRAHESGAVRCRRLGGRTAKGTSGASELYLIEQGQRWLCKPARFSAEVAPFVLIGRLKLGVWGNERPGVGLQFVPTAMGVDNEQNVNN